MVGCAALEEGDARAAAGGRVAGGGRRGAAGPPGRAGRRAGSRSASGSRSPTAGATSRSPSTRAAPASTGRGCPTSRRRRRPRRWPRGRRPGSTSWSGAGRGAPKAALAPPAGPPRFFLPPAAPELNPPARVFQELRAALEGRVYPDLEAKVAAAEATLRRLAADPARVRRLTAWAWIGAAL